MKVVVLFMVLKVCEKIGYKSIKTETSLLETVYSFLRVSMALIWPFLLLFCSIFSLILSLFDIV